MTFGRLHSDGTAAGTTLAPDPDAEGRVAGESLWWVSGYALAGVAVTERTALQSAAILAAFNTIATDVSSLPLDVYQRLPDKSRRDASEHPVSELLARSPDGETTPLNWRQALMGHALAYGTSYAEIERTGRGTPYALHLLDPDSTRPDRRAGVLGFKVGESKWLENANVLRVAGFGFDGVSGYNFVRLIRQSIGITAAAESFGADFYANGSEPNGVVETPQKLTPRAENELREGWYDIHGGAGRRHKLAVLSGGAKFNPTTSDPEKSQLIETRKFQVNDVVRPWRVPPHKVGDFSQAHLANIEASNLDYLTTALTPWLVAIEQEFRLKLFTRQEWKAGYYVEHNLAALLRGDTMARFNAYEIAVRNGWMSRDEVRQRENDNPMGPAKGGDLYTVQAQNVPLENVGREPVATPALKGKETGPGGPDPATPPAPPAKRFNPHHGKDGKFASGKGGGISGGGAPPAQEAAPTDPGELGFLTGLGRQFSGSTNTVTTKDREQMVAYQDRHYGAWAKGLSEKETEAIGSYTGGGYKATNRQLRAGELKPGIAARVKRIDSALDRASTPEDLVAFRGISDLHGVTGVHQHDAESLVGATIRDKGYMSMSLDRTVALGGAFNSYDSGATLVVTVPKGAKVGGMVPIVKAKHPEWDATNGEHEMLAARGHGVRVTQVVRQHTGRIFLYADLLPPE